jgi:hypothetical protein
VIDYPHFESNSAPERICLAIAALSTALLTISIVLMTVFVE